MSDPSNTAQASTDAGAGQAAADKAKQGADAAASVLATASTADAKADAAAKGAPDAKTAAEKTGDAKTDAKADGDGKEGDKAKDDKAKGVPEKYEFKMPEGMELDTAALEKATPVFKELGLSNDQAQKLTDLYAEKVSEMVKGQREVWQKQNEDWIAKMKGDGEYGGDKFDASLGGIVKAIDKIAGKEAPAFKEMLNHTGAGNHPEMARFLHRVGKLVGEGSMVRGDATAQSKSTEEALYPSMQKGN